MLTSHLSKGRQWYWFLVEKLFCKSLFIRKIKVHFFCSKIADLFRELLREQILLMQIISLHILHRLIIYFGFYSTFLQSLNTSTSILTWQAISFIAAFDIQHTKTYLWFTEAEEFVERFTRLTENLHVEGRRVYNRVSNKEHFITKVPHISTFDFRFWKSIQFCCEWLWCVEDEIMKLRWRELNRCPCFYEMPSILFDAINER